MKGRTGVRAGAFALTAALVILVVFSNAFAQTGRIVGKVVEKGAGEPLAFANVIIVGTTMGAMTLNDGTFSITAVPVGTYTVRAMMMGYSAQDRVGVRVDAGVPTEVNFQLEETIVGKTQEIVVEAEIPQIDVKSSDVRQRV